MPNDVKANAGLLKQSVPEFLDDDCQTMAAALSYYTVFSLPPLLMLMLLVLGRVLEPHQVQRLLEGQIDGLMGPAGAEQVRSIFQQAHRSGGGSIVATIVSFVALLVGATGAFGQLQAALNRAWEVKPDPRQGGIMAFLRKRVFTFGMVLGVAFLLLVSLALSAGLAAVGSTLGGFLPGPPPAAVLQLINFVISFGVITALFAAMFKILPDAEIGWRDVWPGAAATAFLFTLGKLLLGLYLGRSDPGAAFGAAGSLAVMLVWIYYSSMILLFGAADRS